LGGIHNGTSHGGKAAPLPLNNTKKKKKKNPQAVARSREERVKSEARKRKFRLTGVDRSLLLSFGKL